MVLESNMKEAETITNSQIKSRDGQIQTYLRNNRNNYFAIIESIEKLKTPSGVVTRIYANGERYSSTPMIIW